MSCTTASECQLRNRRADADHERIARLNETIATLSSRLLRADPDLWVATMVDLAAVDAVRRAEADPPTPPAP
jgi:hypothetical protein